MIGERLEIYSFDYLMKEALSQIPDNIDKRQGSIIYDALAPACLELANFYMELRNTYKDTFADSATGEALDLRVAEQGLTRNPATAAKKRGDFKDAEGNAMSIPLNSRFATISDVNPITYFVLEAFKENNVAVPGAYILQCETLGVIGNEYTGELTNITHIQGLAAATMSTLVTPAQDEETDDELRSRYFVSVKNKPFGGNIAQYREVLEDISGVGQVQVYPVWNGGGTVKCSILDPQLNPCDNDFIEIVQAAIDPENAQGDGGDGLGLAPIGHVVTITTPEEVTCNITTTISVSPGYSIEVLRSSIEQAISDYIDSVKRLWASSDDFNRYYVNLYISRINSAILNIVGVSNVTGTQINGSAADLALTESGTTQQIPKMGTVTLNG
jgi:uncharacterized phage protein gp47/JayE